MRKLSHGERIIAELPMEHLVMYEGYGRLGKIISLNPKCVCCLREGQRFVLVHHGGTKRFTITTDDYVELTIDHIKPKHEGGKDGMRNYQVLCQLCNQIKGSLPLGIEELRDRIKGLVINMGGCAHPVK